MTHSQMRQLANSRRDPVLGRVVTRHVLREKRAQDAVALPDDEMRGIRAVDDVDGVDLARVLLADALEDALAARALDAHGNARILGLEGLGDALGHGQVDGRVPAHLALFPGRLDQLRRDLGRRRRRRKRRTPQEGERRRRGAETH
jgi:hypothetical protein